MILIKIKKTLFIASRCILSILLLVICIKIGYPKKDSVVINETQSNMTIFTDLSEIEERSAVIARVKALKGSEQKILINDIGNPSIGYTFMPVKMLKVYKDDVGIEENVEIEIVEPYCIIEHDDGAKEIRTGQGYLPMIVGNEYLLFLTYRENVDFLEKDYIFHSTGSYQGKYAIEKIETFSKNNLAVDTLTNEDLQIGGLAAGYQYRKNVEQVKAKYLNSVSE